MLGVLRDFLTLIRVSSVAVRGSLWESRDDAEGHEVRVVRHEEGGRGHVQEHPSPAGSEGVQSARVSAVVGSLSGGRGAALWTGRRGEFRCQFCVCVDQ